MSEDSWLDRYYQPLQARFESFINEHPNRVEAVEAMIEDHKKEIELYEKYKDFVSYGVYIAEKV